MDHNNFGHEYRVPSPANSNVSDHHSQRPREQYHMHHAQNIPPVSPRKPVDDAVNDAFDQAQHDTHTQLSPELIAAITQNVIKQLKHGGLDGSASLPSSTSTVPPPPLTAIHHPTPQSPSTTASGTSPSMPSRVYTPPSPQKHTDLTSHMSSQPFPGHLPGGPQSPTRDPAAATSAQPRRVSSPLSMVSESSDKTHTRPKGPPRLSTGKEETTLERIWGQLFDEEGQSTARLSQLLRGLAVHIIEDYEPQHSIVITPTKMCKYYEDVRLSDEIYPWSTVFDDEHTSISRMYRDLECQHHLVQENFDERPDIPGLTPVGFAKWATLLIQAHPEVEFERLQKAVLDMPISNPDDKKERFPKEISRRLFPGHEDVKTRRMIEESICEHAAIEIPRHASHDNSHTPHSQEMPPHRSSASSQVFDSPDPAAPQSHRPSVSFADQPSKSTAPSTYIPSHLERERKPYFTTPAESPIIDDTNHSTAQQTSNPNPIERERKPYSAQPGGGKNYEDDHLNRNPLRSDTVKPRAETIINNSATSRPSRSDSTARSRPVPVAQSRPVEIPKPEVHHHRAPSNSSSRRQRSPSFSRGTSGRLDDFRRSEAEVRGYQSTFEASSVPRDPSFSEDDTKRYFDKQARERAERARRQAEDDARHYGESPRRERDYDRGSDRASDRGSRRGDYGSDDDYYRANGRDKGFGEGYQQPYSGPVYR